MENEKTNTIILLREIITLLIAPSIIRDREKQNNERTKDDYKKRLAKMI